MKLSFLIKTCASVSLCYALDTGSPLRLRVSKEVFQPISPEGGRLNEYMQLPASQYTCVPMPLSSSLTRVPGSTDEFLLQVPPVRFAIPFIFAIEVIPSVVATVSIEPDRVIIFSDRCVLGGSPIIEDLCLNDRYDFRVHTCFTWDAPQKEEGVASFPLAEDGLVEQIRSVTEIEVDIDVDTPGPFARVPKRVLEVMGNSAMGFVTKRLQAEFIRGLAEDYERWATDSAYRLERRDVELELI